jgi:hypothetical protein
MWMVEEDVGMIFGKKHSPRDPEYCFCRAATRFDEEADAKRQMVIRTHPLMCKHESNVSLCDPADVLEDLYALEIDLALKIVKTRKDIEKLEGEV